MISDTDFSITSIVLLFFLSSNKFSRVSQNPFIINNNKVFVIDFYPLHFEFYNLKNRVEFRSKIIIVFLIFSNALKHKYIELNVSIKNNDKKSFSKHRSLSAALGMAAASFFVLKSKKDTAEKPDPKGNAHRQHTMEVHLYELGRLQKGFRMFVLMDLFHRKPAQNILPFDGETVYYGPVFSSTES